MQLSFYSNLRNLIVNKSYTKMVSLANVIVSKTNFIVTENIMENLLKAIVVVVITEVSKALIDELRE